MAENLQPSLTRNRHELTAPESQIGTANTEQFVDILREFCGCFQYDRLLKRLNNCIRRKTNLILASFKVAIRDLSALDISFAGSGVQFGMDERGCYCQIDFTDSLKTECHLEIELALKKGRHNSPVANLRLLTEALHEEIDNVRDAPILRRSDMFSKMVHQVRNPLATILIASSQLALKEDDKLNQDDIMLIDFISKEAERIDEMLNKYSRLIHAGDLHLEEISLRELSGLFDEHSSLKDKFDFEFSTDIQNDQTDCSLLIDKDKINDALMQLLENGLEAIHKGHGKIQLKMCHEQSKLKIKVCDKGPGIRPELLRKVKEPFYSTKDGGSGLGLSIASRIAASHGGRIMVESDEGRFTEVTLELPCK